MKQPDFTIVTPSFGQLDHLACCIASVADQEGVEVEHIVQDGGTVGFGEFSKQMAKQWPDREGYRRIMVSEKDGGMYDAINRGLEKSHGNLFAWLNSDEQYFLGTLQIVKRSFDRDKSADVVLGDVVLLNKDYHPAIYRRIMKPFSWHTRLVHLHSLSAATFFKRSALPNPAFEKRWKIIGDAVLVDHLINKNRKFCCLKRPLSSYMITGENLSLATPGAELPAWHKELGFPPRWVRPFVILHHRIRRLLAGAYQTQKVALKIYRFGSQERENVYDSISYRWHV